MRILFSQWPAITEVAALAWATLFVITLMRHPRRPGWSDIELVDQTLVVLMIGAYAFVAMDAGSRLMAAGLSSGAAAGVVIVIAAVAALVPSMLLRIPERLRRADAGHSPFGSLAHDPTAPRSRMRRRAS